MTFDVSYFKQLENKAITINAVYVMLFDVCLKNIDIYFDRFNFKPELQTNWSGRGQENAFYLAR